MQEASVVMLSQRPDSPSRRAGVSCARGLSGVIVSPVAEGEEFEADQSGIYIPRPKWKSIRQLTFKPGMLLEVAQEQDEIIERIKEARESGAEWVQFSDPTFDSTISIPMREIEDLAWIGEAWKDMQAMKYQLEQRALAQRMQASGMAPAGLPPQLALPPNRAQRRHR